MYSSKCGATFLIFQLSSPPENKAVRPQHIQVAVMSFRIRTCRTSINPGPNLKRWVIRGVGGRVNDFAVSENCSVLSVTNKGYE